MSMEELCDTRLINLALSNSKDKFHKVLILGLDRIAIEFEEHQSRFQSDSFVAINKGMVLDKMK